MRIYLRALSYYRHDLGKLFLLFLVIAAGTILGLMQAWPIAVLLDSVLSSVPRQDWIHRLLLWPFPANRLAQILGLAGLTFGLKLGQEALVLVRTLMNHHINFAGLMRIRCALFQKIQELSLDFHRVQPEADTIYRMSYDTYGCLVILNTFVTVTVASFTLVTMTLLMLSRNFVLTVLALGVAPLLILTHGWCGKALKQRTREGKLHDSEYLTWIQRSVRTIGLTQAFRREADEFGRFQSVAGNNIRAWVRMHWQEVLYAFCVGSIFALGGAAIFGYGGYLVYRDQFLKPTPYGMTVGDLMVILTYLAQLYDPLCKLTSAGATVSSGHAAAVRVFDVLDKQPTIADKPGAIDLPMQARSLELDGVTFGYLPGKPVLRGVSAQIAPGKMVAFVGRSGAGKSTLLNLLPRFYDPQAGALRLDGHDLRDLRLDCVRRHIAVVPQEPLLMPVTIAENIGYGRPDATEAEIRAAAEHAGAAEFIDSLPDGYATRIDEGGKNLSGGQKQRLAIARALITGAPILILDEPTSALDPEREHAITETLHNLRGMRTILLVSHRLSSVIHADEIVVMHCGEIVERGTHGELLAKQGLYHSMARYQLRVDSTPPQNVAFLPEGCFARLENSFRGAHEIDGKSKQNGNRDPASSVRVRGELFL